MSFQKFINPAVDSGVEPLPIFKENSIDFDTGEHKIIKGNFVEITENEALEVWIWKALKTEKDRYLAYSSSYGNDLYKELGYVYDRTVKEQLLYNEIRKCLLVNPYILTVDNFSTEKTISGEEVTITFSVTTIYGEINTSTEVTN